MAETKIGAKMKANIDKAHIRIAPENKISPSQIANLIFTEWILDTLGLKLLARSNIPWRFNAHHYVTSTSTLEVLKCSLRLQGFVLNKQQIDVNLFLFHFRRHLLLL